MDNVDSPFTQAFINSPTIQLDRWKQPEGYLPELGPHDTCIVKLFNKRLLSLSEKFDIKSQSFTFVGVDVYPENLSVFANELIKELGVASKSKAECIFYIRDVFLCTDLRVEISIPGGTKLYVCDQEDEPRDVRTQDLDRCFVSSVLRYMNSLEYNTGKGFMIDPFECDVDKFKQFLSSLCRITRDYDIELKTPLSYEELDKGYKVPLKVLAKYIKNRKLYAWVKEYYATCEVDASNCIKKSPHLIQFYLQVFLNAGERDIVASILLNQNIEQIIAKPLVIYYLSKIARLKDEQMFLLKSISYTNKADVWMALAHCYLSNRYSNFGLLSKALLILDNLSIKKDDSANIYNPLSFTHRPLPLKRRVEFVPDVSGYPQRFRSLLDRKKQLGKESQAADSSLFSLRQLMDRYFQLSPLKREIVTRLSKILKALGKEKFSTLYSQTFQSQKIDMDSIYFKPNEPKQEHIEQQQPVDLEADQQQFPSFIAADLEDKPLYVNQRDAEASDLPMSYFNDDMDQLEKIAEENLATEREYNTNIEQVAKRNALHEIPLKRFIHPQLQELVKLAIDIRHSIDQIVKKLAIDPLKIDTLKNLVLTTESSMVFAEATFLCGHMLLAAFMYISIKKRMVDLFTYYRLLKIMLELKDFNGMIHQLGDMIADLRTLGIIEMENLPLWAEEQLFNLIEKKGRIYVETLLKSSRIKQEAINNSIQRHRDISHK